MAPKSKKVKEKSLKVTLVRSPIGHKPKQRDCVRNLGLRKLNHFVLVPDNSSIRGMINIANHLLKIEEVL